MLNAFVFTLMIIALAYMLVTFFDSGNVISAIGTIFSLGFLSSLAFLSPNIYLMRIS